jgi:hypothetical protein
MERSDHLVNMNDVYVHIEAAHQEQLAIRLRHMDERFDGLTMRKKRHVGTQHGVPTDHFADMDGPNVCRRQPRLRYIGAENKFYR